MFDQTCVPHSTSRRESTNHNKERRIHPSRRFSNQRHGWDGDFPDGNNLRRICSALTVTSLDEFANQGIHGIVEEKNNYSMGSFHSRPPPPPSSYVHETRASLSESCPNSSGAIDLIIRSCKPPLTIARTRTPTRTIFYIVYLG